MELLIDFGSSDKCAILVLRKDNKGNLQILDRFKYEGVSMSVIMAGIDKFKMCQINLPPSAYTPNLAGKSFMQVMKEKGFRVKE